MNNVHVQNPSLYTVPEDRPFSNFETLVFFEDLFIINIFVTENHLANQGDADREGRIVYEIRGSSSAQDQLR